MSRKNIWNNLSEILPKSFLPCVRNYFNQINIKTCEKKSYVFFFCKRRFMAKVFIKDLEELEKEKQFASCYVSPFFRGFYLERYQIYRLKYSSKRSRRKAMAELGVIWNELREGIADETLF